MLMVYGLVVVSVVVVVVDNDLYMRVTFQGCW